MNRIFKPILVLIIISLITFLIVVLSGFKNIHAVNALYVGHNSSAVLVQQTTATPEPVVVEDRSEVGSTDWITVMSFVIAAIIIIPIFLKRKSWSQE